MKTISSYFALISLALCIIVIAIFVTPKKEIGLKKESKVLSNVDFPSWKFVYVNYREQIPINVTVSNAGVKCQMGIVCKSGYKLIDPECCGAISAIYLKRIPYFSYVLIELPRAPQLSGWYKVVDESTMSNGFEIYVNNPNELVIGGAWKGFIKGVKVPVRV